MANETHSLIFYLAHWLVAGISVLITAKVIPGIKVDSFGSAMWAAIIIGLANIFIWPVLIFLTLPINILTLGLFTFVINGAILKIAGSLMSGFKVSTWGAAILGSIVLSIVSMLLHSFVV